MILIKKNIILNKYKCYTCDIPAYNSVARVLTVHDVLLAAHRRARGCDHPR